MYLLFIARFWVNSCYKMAILYKIWPFFISRSAEGLLSYPRTTFLGGFWKLLLPKGFFFENVYSHIFGVKWSSWRVPFEIDDLREGVPVLSNSFSLIFFWFSLNLTLYWKPNLALACFLFAIMFIPSAQTRIILHDERI